MKELVAKLNEPPFNAKLTLVALHKKEPLELLQLVNDVFGEIDEQQRCDVRDEQQEAMAHRMLEFVMILNYRHTMEMSTFHERFLAADPDVIYPLLSWMLTCVPALQKRAFLARYLKNVDVPEEYFADDVVVSLFQQYKQRQAEFKDVHKTLERVKQETNDPRELETEIARLEGEHDQLKTKLSNLKQRVESDPDCNVAAFERIKEAVHLLRGEMNDQSSLLETLNEQKREYEKAKVRHTTAQRACRELELQDLHNRDPDEVLQQLRQTVAAAHTHVSDSLDKDIRARERQLRGLDKVLTSVPMSAGEVSALQTEIRGIEREVDELTVTLDRKLSSADVNIPFYRERATAVETKLATMEERHRALQEERLESEADLRQLNGELAALLVNGEKPKTDKQMRAYMQELADKTKQFKENKAVLQTLRDEVTVLSRTVDILKTRDDNLSEFVAEYEKTKGIAGYSATQDQLESVSGQKSSVDTTKGQTLDEMSSIVLDIKTTLDRKKSQLAPQIKELRKLEVAFHEVEAVYVDKKGQYENASLGLESERTTLQAGVDEHKQSCREQESSYHFLNCLSGIAGVRLKQMQRESEYARGQGRLPPPRGADPNTDAGAGPSTYHDMYTAAIAEQETKAKSQRKVQKQIREQYDDNVEQRQQFAGLRKLLHLKHQLLVNGDQENNNQDSGNSMGGNGGMERMVFD